MCLGKFDHKNKPTAVPPTPSVFRLRPVAYPSPHLLPCSQLPRNFVNYHTLIRSQPIHELFYSIPQPSKRARAEKKLTHVRENQERFFSGWPFLFSFSITLLTSPPDFDTAAHDTPITHRQVVAVGYPIALSQSGTRPVQRRAHLNCEGCSAPCVVPSRRMTQAVAGQV